MKESMRRYKAGVFQALAHPTRIALVECLEREEHSVGQLCERIGIEQANASQHLAVLRNKYIVQSRKEGNQIFYRLSDPLLGKVFEAMREFFLSHLSEALEVLRAESDAAAADEKALKAPRAPKAPLPPPPPARRASPGRPRPAGGRV